MKSPTKLIRLLRTPVVRTLVLFALDAGSWAFGITIAAVARYEFDYAAIDWTALGIVVGIVAVLQLVWGLLVGLYPGRWRLASTNEALTLIVGSLIIGSGLVVGLLQFSRPRPLPISVAGGAAIFVMFSFGVRILVSIARDTRQVAPRERRHAIFFGAGEAGHDAARAMLRDPESNTVPIAFLDDDPTKRRLRVHGRPVVGTRHDLAAAASQYDADVLVITMPSATRSEIAEIARTARTIGMEVLILPRLAKSLSSSGAARTIRPLRFADFLGRDPVALDREGMAGLIRNRRVLVTGAGGSIGSELCRAIQELNPAVLTMLDRDENGLHHTQLMLDGRAMLDSSDLVVADIRDIDALEVAFARHRPEVVFHAAALKHVPLLEMYPTEAYKTNVLGTNNVLRSALDHGVGTFVNVSTDKAATPINVLGYTKRIGEMLTSGYSSPAMTAISVRFGNVLGSSGSVIPTLTAQIEAGGPITITDPEVSRYFMTTQEAVQLVLQAGVVGTSAQLLVLDMGTPVRIADLARELVAQIAPDADIEVVYTGLRPGEKLHEILAGPEDRRIGNPHEGLTSYAVPSISPDIVESLETADAETLREKLQWIATQYLSTSVDAAAGMSHDLA